MLISLCLGGVLVLGQPPSLPAASEPAPIPAVENRPSVSDQSDVTEAAAAGWQSIGGSSKAAEEPNKKPSNEPAQVPTDASIEKATEKPPEPSTEKPGQDPVNVDVVVPAPAVPEEEAAEESSAPARYAFMRGAQGTWLGTALDDHRLTVFGWTQFSYTNGTASQNNFPVAFNDRAGEFLMNQNYLHFERMIDTSKNECQWGFVSETILPGSDYRFTLPRGLANGQLTENDGFPNLYGVDPYQFYGQMFLPDLGPRGTKLILGRFATHVGFEVTQAPDTPFLSRSYLFLFNPFTHTGLWATTQLNDAWSIGNGVATGSDTFIDPANRLTYLGQVKWAPPNARASVLCNVVVTDPTFDQTESFSFYNVYDLIVNYKVSERLNYALDATYSHIRGVPDTGFTDWYGAANYLVYQLKADLTGTLRVELFNDTTGFRTGSKGLYSAVTAGLTWKPNPALLIRPSLRYDYNSESTPFEGEPDLFTTAIDVIVRW